MADIVESSSTNTISINNVNVHTTAGNEISADPAAGGDGAGGASGEGPRAITNDKVPPDMINLRLLLVSGSRSDILAKPDETIETVRQRAFNQWPREWASEAPQTYQNLRILYWGKILDNNVTLASLKIPAGQTTVVHALIRNGAVEPPGEERPPAVKPPGRCACCVVQ